MNDKIDVLAVMDDAIGDVMVAQASAVATDVSIPELCAARAAIAELIEAAIEMDAVFDTYVFDYGVTQHGLSVKDRIRTALARVGGA